MTIKLCGCLFLTICIAMMSLEGAVCAADDSMLIDVYAGEPIDMDTLMEDLQKVPFIFIGEVHTIQGHHEFQSRVLNELAERDVKLALGMEMFNVDQQRALDEWSGTNEGLDGLVLRLGPGGWTNLRDYAELLLTARRRSIPILALNAPDRLVKKIAAHGLDEMTAAEKALLPHGVTVNPLNEKLLKLRLMVHRAFQERSLANIVAAQTARDEVMAATIHAFVSGAGGGDRTVLVVAGTGHMNYGFGVPEKTEKLTGKSYRIILPTESGRLELSDEEKRQSVPVHITHEDLRFLKTPIADYLHVVPLQDTVIVRR